MFTRFGQIFWGLLVVILDLRVRGFDLLPDFVGYILVAVGAGGLIGASRQFATVRMMSWVLAGMSLLSLFRLGRFGIGLALVILVVDCVMMWSLLGGVMEFTAARQRPELAQQAAQRRLIYLALKGVAALVMLLALVLPKVAGLLGLVLFLCSVALLVLILHLLYRVRYEVARDQAPGGSDAADANDDVRSEAA